MFCEGVDRNETGRTIDSNILANDYLLYAVRYYALKYPLILENGPRIK
jgi:hypothetical protein